MTSIYIKFVISLRIRFWTSNRWNQSAATRNRAYPSDVKEYVPIFPCHANDSTSTPASGCAKKRSTPPPAWALNPMLRQCRHELTIFQYTHRFHMEGLWILHCIDMITSYGLIASSCSRRMGMNLAVGGINQQPLEIGHIHQTWKNITASTWYFGSRLEFIGTSPPRQERCLGRKGQR